MIFVDTSAMYAVLDRGDQNHGVARAVWLELLESGESLFTTNYAVVETFALAQNRLGLEAVRVIHEDILPALEVRWIDETSHALAITALLAAQRRKLSLVDCASFTAMRQIGSRTAFAFDQHFIEEGFAFPIRPSQPSL